jgi:hypothetical protein
MKDLLVNPLRLATQIMALRLEIKTNNVMKLTRYPRSVMAQAKKEYGLRGNDKQRILNQLLEIQKLVDAELEKQEQK